MDCSTMCNWGTHASSDMLNFVHTSQWNFSWVRTFGSFLLSSSLPKLWTQLKVSLASVNKVKHDSCTYVPSHSGLYKTCQCWAGLDCLPIMPGYTYWSDLVYWVSGGYVAHVCERPAECWWSCMTQRGNKPNRKVHLSVCGIKHRLT